MRNTRGSVVIFAYLMVAVVAACGSAMMVRSTNEQHVAQRHVELARAFEAAESGVDEGIIQLRNDFNWTGVASTAVNSTDTASTYAVTVTDASQSDMRVIRSTGTFTSPGATAMSQTLEAQVRSSIPPNFYNNAIYAAEEVEFKGNAYSVVGNVLTGETDPLNNTGHVTGTITQDASASPLPALNFQQLHDWAQSQGHIYDAARLKNIQKKTDYFPSSFCYSGGTDPTTCTPNINYVTTDLVLNGNIGTIGGFFVVVGNVLTDPEAESTDTTINGNGTVTGVIYTTGEFTLNGGGNKTMNVDGGVFTGKEATLNGTSTVQYNASYMSAIQNLNLTPGVQLISWRECAPQGC